MRNIKDDAVVQALPATGFIRDYVEYAMEAMDAPALYHLGTALAMAATVMPPMLHLYLAGQKLHPNLYVLLVGDSVIARKSTVMNFGIDLLRETYPDRVGHSPRSVEGLMQSLLGAPCQLIAEPEFSRFLSQSHGRNYLNAIKQAYTDIFDCKTFSSVTAHDTLIVDHPRLSILAAIAPPYLERYTEPQDWTGGFWARWMVFCAQRDRFELKMVPNYAGRDKLKATYERLYQYTPNTQAHLTTAAMEYYEPYARRMDDFARDQDRDSEARGLIGRSGGLVLKIALLLAATRRVAALPKDAPRPDISGADTLEVIVEDIKHAVDIVALHITSTMGVIEDLAQNPYMLLRRKVLGVLSAAGSPVSMGTITLACKVPVKVVEPILQTLQEERLLVQLATSGGLLYGLTVNGVALTNPKKKMEH